MVKVSCTLEEVSPGVFSGECDLPTGAGDGRRRSRPPSKYNIFIKECLAREKGKRPHTENFRFCATEWKKR